MGKFEKQKEEEKIHPLTISAARVLPCRNEGVASTVVVVQPRQDKRGVCLTALAPPFKDHPAGLDSLRAGRCNFESVGTDNGKKLERLLEGFRVLPGEL